MGFFDFVKSVGKKMTGATEAHADEAQGPSAEALKQELDKYQLGSQNVQVAITGDEVTLSGSVADQATYEKVVMAVGNAHGVARVNTDDLKSKVLRRKVRLNHVLYGQRRRHAVENC